MTNYDLCLTWNWEYDADFVELLDGACQSHGLSLLQVTPENLSEIMQSLVNDPIDLRLQSKTSDGVPDDIIRDMTERLVEFVGNPRFTLQSYQGDMSLSYRGA